MFHALRRIAATDLTTLITGETGTGKELVAHALHSEGPRAAHPFIVIDCAAISSSLAESMLFGHERGAFTGAVERRVSPFLRAEGGTVFLDEMGELPLELQPKLLRALEGRKIQAVGSSTLQPINARVIAATRRDLKRESNGGSFRSDLYFRIAHLTVKVPALRERPDDIPALIRRFAVEMGAEDKMLRVPPESVNRLLKYDWPGNVRELRNVVTSRLALAEPEGPIALDQDLAEERAVGGAEENVSFDAALTAFEASYWTALSARCEGNLSRMSRVSGRARSNIRKILERIGLRAADGE